MIRERLVPGEKPYVGSEKISMYCLGMTGVDICQRSLDLARIKRDVLHPPEVIVVITHIARHLLDWKTGIVRGPQFVDLQPQKVCRTEDTRQVREKEPVQSLALGGTIKENAITQLQGGTSQGRIKVRSLRPPDRLFLPHLSMLARLPAWTFLHQEKAPEKKS